MFDVCVITGEHAAADILARADAALRDIPQGRVALQLRAKHLPPHEHAALARSLRALTKERGVLLMLNADLALAREVGADGVQLPEAGPSVAQARQALGTSALIGTSRHDAAGLRAAAEASATFATLGPVFATPGKAAPLGVETFADLVRTCALPVLALGGVTIESTAGLVRAGAHGVALIREVWDSPRPDETVAELLGAVDLAKRGREMA